MIPARRVTLFSNWFAVYMRFRMRMFFNRLVVAPFKPKEGHSVLLLCNHLVGGMGYGAIIWPIGI